MSETTGPVETPEPIEPEHWAYDLDSPDNDNNPVYDATDPNGDAS